MKFGETLYERSVPKWAAYNVKYNELKQLIKLRTAGGAAIPLSIPGKSTHQWQDLENELCQVLKDQYDNTGLFLRSKQGEIERRLAHLEKQVRLAQHGLSSGVQQRPVSLARRYQRLVHEAENIGDDIEALSRFAAVQRTALRKILKKYKKWTGSTVLQDRINHEIFSSGALRINYAEDLERLATQTKVLRDDLVGPMLFGHPKNSTVDSSRKSTHNMDLRSSIQQISDAVAQGPLNFDAALSTASYGEASGSVFYWIHPDNVDEVRTLVLRHMRDLKTTMALSRSDSTSSGFYQRSPARSPLPETSHVVLFDNAQRYLQDSSNLRPSKIAMSGLWGGELGAILTLSDLVPRSPQLEIVTIPKIDLSKALTRVPESRSFLASPSSEVSQIQDYLAEHRDVKALAMVHYCRSRFAGITNTVDVGMWAILDTSIVTAPIDLSQSGIEEPDMEAGESFPHAVLHIRWEFARTPEIIRALDTSRLAERVQDFRLEDIGIFTAQKYLAQPSWQRLLKKDIRKVPILSRKARSGPPERIRTSDGSSAPTTSDAPSTDEPPSSIFSATHGQSSATSDEFSSHLHNDNTASSTQSKSPTITATRKKKKRARVIAPEPEPPIQRYWNEFDDGDSDVNVQESYAIYVDPDAPSFPGAETVSKAFRTMYQSLSKGTSKLISFFPMSGKTERQQGAHERTPLLNGQLTASQISSDADLESSSSENEGLIGSAKASATKSGKNRRGRADSRNLPSTSMYRANQQLSIRQKRLEKTLMQFYSGLIVIAYILLAMASILLGTGRKKAALEVDAGVVTGVIAALTCVCVSTVLICLRRQHLSVLHWGLFTVNCTAVFVVGVGILLIMFGQKK